MRKLTLSDFDVSKKEKRDAYDKVLDFINSDRCYEGVVCVLYGLLGTGKKTIMKQLIAENSDRLSFVFLEAEKEDTMNDVYNILDEAFHNRVNCVFIDEITNISDFIDDSAVLADIYAKEGIRIVLSGTDSLSFIFAENSPLYGRVENICTTYIPFEEHCRVFGTNDIDDYISYGGMMKMGTAKEDHIVYDYQSARKYLDDAVAGNIYRSIQRRLRYYGANAISNVTQAEMCIAIKKMVERYSGMLTPELANEELKRIFLSFPNERKEFIEIEGVEFFETLKMNKPDIIKEFAKEINADTRIIHKFDENMVIDLENQLLQLGFLSAINHQELVYDEDMGWDSIPLYKEYYLIQPAIKYYHLQKALKFVKTNEYYEELSRPDQQFVMDKLDSKIKGDMTEQIVLFETANALPTDKYFVCKVSFSDSVPDNSVGEYDMLIYDKANNSYYAFGIEHTTEPNDEQYRHLLNEKFKEIADYKYGEREQAFVLYNGEAFKATSGIVYLNISDFAREIARCKDVKAAMKSLSRGV